MGVVADEVIVALEARMGDYDRKITQSVNRFETGMTSMERSALRAEKAVSFAARSMGAALAGVSVVAVARGMLAIADEAKNLDARLRLATAQTGSFGRATEDVRRIAEATRSGLTDTATLYGNFTRNARDLGISQMETARATETVSKTFKISGADAVEAAQGTGQLVQALQSGVLRGDEFNTIMESSPRLARLLADSLDVPIGSLRAMAEEGTLTSDKLVRAFTDQRFTRGIDEEFQQLPVTFDQAMAQVQNAAIITFGAFDRGGEFSTAIANFIMEGTGGFAEMEQSAEQFGITARGTIEGLGGAFGPVLDEGLRVFDLLGIRIQNFSADGRREIAGLLGAIDDAINLFDRGRVALGGKAGGIRVFGREVSTTSNLQGRFTQKAAASDAARQGAREGRVADDWRGSGVFAGMAGAPPPGPPPPARIVPPKAKKARAGPRGRSAESIRLEAEREEQAYQNELAQQNDAILSARRALATAAETVAQYERDRITIEQGQYTDQQMSLVRQGKRTQAQADELIALENQRAALEVEAVNAQERERQSREATDIASSSLGNQIDLARSQEQLATTAAERRDLSLRILDLQYQQERLELEAIVASQDATAAQKQIAQERLSILGQLQAGDKASAERSNQGPMAAYLDSIPDTAAEMNESLEHLRVNGIQSVIDGLSEAGARYVKLGGIAGDVVNGIIRDLIRLAVQQAVVGAASGGMGGAVSAIGSFFGGFFAKGGVPPRGKLSIVGENGPEIIAGDGRARVIPMAKAIRPVAGNVHAARPQITVIAPQQFDLRGTVMTKDLVQQMDQRNRSYTDAVAGAMGKSLVHAVPTRMAEYERDGF